jgi:hypothetical protein
MALQFFPSSVDVQRYRRLRGVGRTVSDRILKTAPSQTLEAIGDALGLRRSGILILDSVELTSVFADCCIYDWYEDGKNLVQRYAETHPATPGTDEAYLLAAYTQAKYRVLAFQSAVANAGVYVYDAVREEEIFLMDLGFSRSLTKGVGGLVTRTVPLGNYWMTGGAALPIVSADNLKRAFERSGKALLSDSFDGPSAITTSIVRACLATGSAEHVAYGGTMGPSEGRRKERPTMPGWLGSKRRLRLS